MQCTMFGREQMFNLFVFAWGTCVLRSLGGQMSKLLADECRKRAAECAETAREQQDPEIKREYSDLAAMWRLIAMNSEETESV